MDELDAMIDALDEAETLRIEVLDEVGFDLPAKSPFARGSDPRVATCRGRLQNRRCQLNQEINKELRLRAGAENLFKATTNRKLKETVALELSFVNSNLQLLKEQLAELNSSVELYQNDSKESVVPMIPLGLKETKDVDFREPFKDFILEHYSEDATSYEEAISDFMDMRQAMRTPIRSPSGVSLLFRYYNQLYFIERRFFPPDRSLGIYFEWFDSLTGVPSCQRTVAFEKACVLFNMAAIYTQIGAKQERRDCDGLDGAVDALLRAAGTLRYIHENFTNAPSVDLSADMLDTLVNLMMAQARECLFEKLQIQAKQDCTVKDLELCDDLDLCLDLCQESSQVSQCYSLLYQKMQSDHVFHYVPYSWVSLVHVKTEFYKGLAHHHCATGLLNAPTTKSSTERLSQLHTPDGRAPWTDWSSTPKDRNVDGRPLSGPYFPYKDEDRVALGKAHLNEALNLYEEAMRLQRMCRELKAKDCLYRVLREHQDRAYRESNFLEDSPDFLELIEAPAIQPSTKFQLSLTSPDFAQHRVEDLFKSLGPVAIFSAKRHWSAPRLVHLQKAAKSSHKLHRKESDAKKDRSRSSNKQFTTEDGEILRNGLRALRHVSSFEKRDRSEDNSAYYLHKDVLKNDEKYANEKSDSLTDVRMKLNANKAPIVKQNGVYINGYNSSISSSDYHRKLNGRLNGSEHQIIKKVPSSNGLNSYCPPDKILGKSRSKNDLTSNGKGSREIITMKNGHPIRNGLIKKGELLRRVSSDFNISPASVALLDKNQEGYGFSVRGDAPVIIAGVEINSLADMGGMKEGDFIVAIGDKDVKWWPHDEVVSLIKASGDSLSLKLVTPMDRNYLKQMSPQQNRTPQKDSGSNPGSVSAASSSSSGSTGNRTGANRTSGRRAPSWNPFKRNNNSRDSSSNRGSHCSNVIFR